MKDFIAIVAECDTAAVCADLAAAYYAVAGGTPPELHCGEVPLLEPEELPLPKRLKDLSPESLIPKTPAELCDRLPACEVAKFGRTSEYSLRGCLKGGMPKAVIECARLDSCDATLACSASTR
jgi:hypothetical protein